MNKQDFPKRIALFALGVVVYGFAAALMANQDVGVSPISSIAYSFTFLFPSMTLGTAQLIMNSAIVLIQILWLGKAFEFKSLWQWPASLAFSIVIDLTMPLVRWLGGLGAGLAYRCVLFAFSIPVMAVGLSLLLRANLVILPGDALAGVLAQKTGWPFGRAKVWIDCICVAVTVALCLVALGRIVGVQVGTVISALTVGRLVRWISARWGKAN